MVKKLYKYEFINLGRWMVIIFAAVVLISGAARLTFAFANDESDLGVAVQIGAVMSCGLTLSFAFAISTILPVVRFYKNLLTHEGYLTLSLPVSINQHLICKLVVAVVLQFVTALSVFAAVVVFSLGTGIWAELWQGLPELLEMAWEEVGVNMIFFMIEVIVMALLSMVVSLLRYYFCMAMGQLFGKNRILGAVLVYVILSIGTQILTSLFTGISLPMGTILLNRLTETSMTLTFHIVMCVGIVVSAALCAGFYAVTHYMFKHRLNLE